jgi:hypothetical protein
MGNKSNKDAYTYDSLYEQTPPDQPLISPMMAVAKELGITLPIDFVEYWRVFYASDETTQTRIKTENPLKFKVYCELLWKLLEQVNKKG